MNVRIFPVAALAIATAFVATAQNAAPAGPRPPRFASSVAATRVVRGRVTSVTGGVVRGAEIRAREVNGRETRLVTTDDMGSYEIRDLLPGTWNLTASKTGFITQQYGQRRPFSAAEPLNVGERQSVQANFTLGRAGAISGRVLDEFGDPVAGARVQVLRSRFTRGRRTLAPTGVGEEQPDITFSLAPVRAVRVSGTVLSARGGPAEDASVRLVNARDFSLVGVPLGNFGMSQANGAFTFINVVPGSYILEAHAGSVFGGVTEGAENASVPVTIGPEDVTGLTITTTPAGAITGVVTTESGVPPPPGVQIKFESTTGGMQFESTVERRSRPDGPGRGGTLPPYGFRLPVTAGGFHLGVSAPQGWMLKAIEIGGTDMTDKPVEVRGGSTDARVVLTDRVTQLEGSVTNGSRPVPAVDVVVFPDEPALWAFPARHVRALKSGADGTFTVRGIPPHQSYLVVAVEHLDDGETQDPEFLEGLRDLASRFSIDYGESRNVALRVVERR